MTFETPTANAAYLAGQSEADYLRAQDIATEVAEHYGNDADSIENRRYVSESDVADAEGYTLIGYGGNHRRLIDPARG